MASRADIEAGKAHVLLYLKNQLAGGLNAVGGQLKAIGSQAAAAGAAVAGIGAGILAPLAGAVQHFLAVGGALDDMSARTGISRTVLGELKFAAEQSGASLEDVEKATARMQRTIVEATQGSKSAVEALGMLGLSAADLSGKLPDEQLQLVSDRLAGITDPATRTAAAMEILGRSGTSLLPMVGSLAALREEARSLGVAPSEDASKMADQLGDSIDKVKTVLSATVFEVGAALAPMLIPAVEAVKNIAVTVSKWVKDNAELVRTVAMIGAGLVAAGTVIAAIGGAIVAAGAVLTGIATIVTTIGTVIGAILSPVGLIVVAVVAVGAAIAAAVVQWVRFSEAGQAAWAALMAGIEPFVKAIKTAFGGIVDAFKAGDMELAFKILVTGIQLLWAQAMQAMMGAFYDLVEWVAGNPLVAELLGEELVTRIGKSIDASRKGRAEGVAGLTKELDTLRTKAADKAERARSKAHADSYKDEPVKPRAKVEEEMTAEAKKRVEPLTSVQGGFMGNQLLALGGEINARDAAMKEQVSLLRSAVKKIDEHIMATKKLSDLLTVG